MGGSYITTQEYDALGRPIRVFLPNDNVQYFTYQPSGPLKTQSTTVTGITTFHLSDIQYNAKGQPEMIVYGNGVYEYYFYDANTFRLKQKRAIKESTEYQNLYYFYDAVGDVVRKEDTAQTTYYNGSEAVAPKGGYLYDPMYRLVEATGREHTGQNQSVPQYNDSQAWIATAIDPGDPLIWRNYKHRYTYDKVGNILEMKVVDGWKRTYEYADGKNRLEETTLDGDSASYLYSHDAHGNMTKMPHLTKLEWDALDRLQMSQQQVYEDGTAEQTFYLYDGQGNRLRKATYWQTAGAATPNLKSETLYLAGYEVVSKCNATGAVEDQWEITHTIADFGRIGSIEQKVEGDDLNVVHRFTLSDLLGSATTELDLDGVVISFSEYHPFGTVAYQAKASTLGSLARRYQFCGKEKDEESGLHYYGARYYSSWLGRFVSVDPKEGKYFFQSSYAYAENSPVTKIDFNGEGTAPIYVDGLFVGTDSEGFKGQAILLDSDQYSKLSEKQKNEITKGSLKHEDALNLGGIELGDAIDRLNLTTGSKGDKKLFESVGLVLNHIVGRTNKKGFENFSINQLASSSISMNIDYINTKLGFALYNIEKRNYAAFAVTDKENKTISFVLNHWGSKDGIGAEFGYMMEATVANLQNTFVHEASGHFSKGLGMDPKEHAKVYETQILHPSFKEVTPVFKAWILKSYNDEVKFSKK